MNENKRNFLEFLKDLELKYSDSITNISKTGEGNYFIENDTQMICVDKLSKDFAEDNSNEELSSVDGLYYVENDSKLILYFFEFKKMNFFAKDLLATEKLNNVIKNIENCSLSEDCEYEYLSDLKKIKKDIYNKILVQLKIKPLETLILLHNLYEKENGEPEDIVNIEKHYYLVSQTPNEHSPYTKNKSKTRRKGKSKEIFDFLNKLYPFPFKQTKAIPEKSFLKIISSED